MRRLLLMMVAFFVAESGNSSGQSSPVMAEIHLHLLNHKTGRPLNGRYVALVLSGPDGKYKGHDEVLRGKSNSDGVLCSPS